MIWPIELQALTQLERLPGSSNVTKNAPETDAGPSEIMYGGMTPAVLDPVTIICQTALAPAGKAEKTHTQLHMLLNHTRAAGGHLGPPSPGLEVNSRWQLSVPRSFGALASPFGWCDKRDSACTMRSWALVLGKCPKLHKPPWRLTTKDCHAKVETTN